MSILQKAAKLIFANDPIKPVMKLRRSERKVKTLTERELIQLESQIGALVFGPPSHNVLRREFFNLDKDTWIWHETARKEDGTTSEVTVRYEVKPNGILKVHPGPRYAYLEGAELQNFIAAVREYYNRVTTQLYRRDPKTGQKF